MKQEAKSNDPSPETISSALSLMSEFKECGLAILFASDLSKRQRAKFDRMVLEAEKLGKEMAG